MIIHARTTKLYEWTTSINLKNLKDMAFSSVFSNLKKKSSLMERFSTIDYY